LLAAGLRACLGRFRKRILRLIKIRELLGIIKSGRPCPKLSQVKGRQSTVIQIIPNYGNFCNAFLRKEDNLR